MDQFGLSRLLKNGDRLSRKSKIHLNENQCEVSVPLIEGLLIQDLETRLPDLGSKVESIVSKLVALGLVKSSLQRGTQLSRTAIDLMSAPPQAEAE